MIRLTFLKRLKARFRPTRSVNAPDTVIAGQVRDWIAEGSAKAIEAARTIPFSVLERTKIAQGNAAAAKRYQALVRDGHLTVNEARALVELQVNPLRSDAHPDYAEIIRIANSLLRLAGAK